MTDNFLSLEGISKSFGTTQVVKNVSMAFDKGEFITFLGPSGCGKTTILRMIAGFETPSSGTIRVDGKDITNLRPNQRQIGMVFQAYALFPNMTVGDNIAFGLKIAGKPKSEIGAVVTDMLRLIGLPGYEKRYPYELSGGQQQRVALARALAPKPRMLLLDEPLSALDAKIRVSLRQEIRAIQRDLGITTVFVTHDQEEALSISDRIVVLSAGNVEQVGNPFEIYNTPKTRFVATFVGTLNALEGVVEDVATRTVSIDGQKVTVDALPAEAKANGPITLRLRPEAISLRAAGPNDIVLDAKVSEIDFLGSVIRIKLGLGKNNLNLDTFNDQHTPPPQRGSTVQVAIARSDLISLEA